jgi:hypothetical protein
LNGRLHFFLKIWEFSQISPKFPNFSQISPNSNWEITPTLHDFGARLLITFYSLEKLFLACLEYVPWAHLHKNTLSQNLGFPKVWEISINLGNFPKFGKFPKWTGRRGLVSGWEDAFCSRERGGGSSILGMVVAVAAVPGRVCNARAPGELQTSTRLCCMRQPRACACAHAARARGGGRGTPWDQLEERRGSGGEERRRGAAARSGEERLQRGDSV